MYTVSEVMLTGWINIAPISSGAFSVGSGTTFACDFGNLPTGSISGYKWHDVDIDGVWDAAEFGISLTGPSTCTVTTSTACMCP